MSRYHSAVLNPDRICHEYAWEPASKYQVLRAQLSKRIPWRVLKEPVKRVI
jgi:hypothetical protein